MKPIVKVYDVEVSKDGSVKVLPIDVLETSIADGASVPTYKIRYPDGHIARCSTDMYHTSAAAAVQSLKEDTIEALASTKRAQIDLNEEIARLNNLLDKLSKV